MIRIRVFVTLAATALVLTAGVAGIASASTLTGSPRLAPSNVSYFSLAYSDSHLQKCLGIPRNGKAGIFTCTYAKDQKWHRGKEKGTSGFYQFINNKGKCLGVAGASESAGAQVIGSRCNGSNSQYWDFDFFDPQSHVCYIFNYHSDKVLQPNGTSNGALVKQQPWGPTMDQVWVFVSDSN